MGNGKFRQTFLKSIELMWYLADVFLRSEYQPALPQDKVLWEELFVLVDAADQQEAIARAKAVAAKSEAKYQNAAGERVQWKVITVQASPSKALRTARKSSQGS